MMVGTTWYGGDGPHLAAQKGCSEQARLVKTVKVQGRAAAHPGSDRRLPGAVTHPRPWLAPAVVYGRVLDPGRGLLKEQPRGRYRLGRQPVALYSIVFVWEAAQCTVRPA